MDTATPLERHPTSPSDWGNVVTELYGREFESLCRAAGRFIDTRAQAEDVVQDAFVKFIALTQRPAPGRELAYLRSMVLNGARTVLRRRLVSERHLCREICDVVPEPDDLVCTANELASLIKMLDRLPPRQREVLALRYRRDFSEREIAHALRISPGSVKAHAARGITRLRNLAGVTAPSRGGSVAA